MDAYYNEFDPAAAHILRHMIDAGVIAPGVVDERSIKEVSPDDLKDFTQVHLFAGGGFWSCAARSAGWPDSEPIWTASCPCQPFSAAGKGAGTDDPRHLWPDVYRLARAIRPPVIMGEQVAAKAGYGWFDGVRSDMAREGYASRSIDFPACGVDAPHQRNRQYWIALYMAKPDEFGGRAGAGRRDGAEVVDAYGADRRGYVAGDAVERCAEAIGEPGDRTPTHGKGSADRVEHVHSDDGGSGEQRDMADTDQPFGRIGNEQPARQFTVDEQDPGIDVRAGSRDGGIHADADRGGRAGRTEGAERGQIERAAPERDLLRNGTYWSDAEWITCHDDKARRTKPGLRFLVDGLPGRVDLWRVGGNAIVPEAAKEVIAAFIDAYGLPSGWGEIR
jgi:DNA (cytosine-5)-methyltransferase 1